MSVILNDVTFCIGSKVRGTISFRNGSSKKIRGINVELYYQEFAYHYRNGKLNTSPSGVWMSVTLKDSVFHIGSQVERAIALQNPCGFRMRGIDVELLSNELIHSYSGKDSRSSMTRKKKLEKHKMRIPIQEDTVEEFKTDFSMKIPASMQETRQRRFSDIVAFVKITLDLGKTTNISCLHEIDILPATPAESI